MFCSNSICLRLDMLPYGNEILDICTKIVIKKKVLHGNLGDEVGTGVPIKSFG